MASWLCSIRRSLFTAKYLNSRPFLNVFRTEPIDFYNQHDPTLVRCYSVSGSPPSDPPFKGNQENREEFTSSFGNTRGSYGGLRFGSANANQRMSPSNSFNFINPTPPWNQKDTETGRTMDPMTFVKGILGQDRRGHVFGRNQSPQSRVEQNADVVHIKMLRNNTFVTVTDAKGNKKIGASAGSLPGGGKVSRYGAEATAEHVGRLAKSMELKAVVMRVNGFTYFKKKKQAILSFREGFTNSRGDANPIVYIEDTTRKPHNGCRLPRQRRV